MFTSKSKESSLKKNIVKGLQIIATGALFSVGTTLGPIAVANGSKLITNAFKSLPVTKMPK